MGRVLLIILGILLLSGFIVFPIIQKEFISPAGTNQEKLPAATESNNKKNIPRISVVATGLEVPWALAFLPDGSMLVTERPGRVRLITNDGKLLPDPLLTLQVVQKIQGEGGLHGIVPHPDFATNHLIYLYYTYENFGQESLNRVAQYTLENNQLVNEKIIVDNIPGALFHDGGRIKFGPDKLLYITTGDAQQPSLAQDTNALAGKTLRVTADGKPAPGNPFNNSTYTYGHRNSQGIAWDKNGNIWETEHGRSNPTGFDEVNLIEIGKNYGWPDFEGNESGPGIEVPESHSGPTNTWAPGGASFVNDSLFFAGLRGQALYEAKILYNRVIVVSEIKEHFKGEFGRFRDVITGPDGMLYVTTSNRDGRGTPSADDDKILRINPEKL